ncbi:DNA-binding transcriptional regulator, LysR family [Mesorhizobium albiziae]|uniref:DNA-binding transcriptional regulator, LysR family n=1 Tax=Neomesorhizobium albiziae TaxID=335020 RepID=A0A1I4D7S2_9HYPH|nr:LysR family transcriptional regulator [Mesorhizobium albiziae]GLS33622.1 LysR family transcriptional regulator [Mesorhizobium albiziae]SFK89165.1 DNA-binding transcriptional regulator, LysR family [Mesorhizobium albiziae]
MIDLNDLVIFARVAETRSFSEAARRMAMPVSTVSRRVAELEDQLDVRLFERSTRSLRLTDIGMEILEQAQRGAEVNEAVDSIVSHRLSEVRGTLRLSAPPSISENLLAPLIGTFRVSYPAVEVHLIIADRHLDHISEGIDLALRLGPFADSSLVARPVLRYRHRLVASPDYLEGRDAPTHPRELRDHQLLAFAYWSRQHRWILERDGVHETVNFRPRVTMNDFTGLATLLAGGGGIGELPPIVAPALFASGRLVEVMPQWRFATRDLSIVYLGNRNISRPVRMFRDFALQMIPKLAGELPV